MVTLDKGKTKQRAKKRSRKDRDNNKGDELEHRNITEAKQLQNQYAVLAVIDSQLFSTILMANFKKCELGRLCFTPSGFYTRNPDSIATQIVHCRLNRCAFLEYMCKGEEITIECSLAVICPRIKGKARKDVMTVISVPHSTREDGQHGPITFQFVNVTGLKDVTKLVCADLDLDMPLLGDRELDYIFTFQMEFKEFKRIVTQLNSDNTADRIYIETDSKKITIENANGDSTCSEMTTIYTDSEELHYTFSPPVEGDSFGITISRPKVCEMLSLTGVNSFTLSLQASETVFTLQYILPDNRGFIKFMLASMISNHEDD